MALTFVLGGTGRTYYEIINVIEYVDKLLLYQLMRVSGICMLIICR